MLRVYAASLGTRAYMDQPCTVRDPESFEPRCTVPPALQLSVDDIRSFYERGYLGPFTLCPRDEMIAMREEILAEIAGPSAVYGFHTGRDRHLDSPAVARLVARPELTERMAQLLGPNLLLWRSQVFLKPPGAGAVDWHQASTYLMEAVSRPALVPPDIDRLFQLEAWVACDDVDEKNGCVRLFPGSHRRIHTMRVRRRPRPPAAECERADPSHFVRMFGSSFAKAGVRLEHDYPEERAVKLELEAGQFVLFTEQVIHGSFPNRSARRRFALAFRVVPPEVQVYPGTDVHTVSYLGERYDLTKYGTVLLRGADPARLNRAVVPDFR
jgi:non-heme Fe2+,alpha-ketoglutarate-dependent halogenase